ncbi:hypothetical protein ABPG75_009619 [Micractinium tetrahymenae]
MPHRPLGDYAAPFLGQLSDAQRLLRPIVGDLAGCTGRPELACAHSMLEAAEASIAETLEAFEGGTDAGDTAGMELRLVCLMESAAPLKQEVRRLDSLLAPTRQHWRVFREDGIGLLPGRMPLPQQDELAASVGQVAALACLGLRRGGMATDTLGRLSFLSALGGFALRAVGRAARGLQAQMGQMADAASPTALEELIRLGLSTVGASGTSETVELHSLHGLLADPAASVFGAEALRGLRAAAAFSCDGHRLRAAVHLVDEVLALSWLAPGVPESMMRRYIERVNDAFFPALQAMHTSLVGTCLLDEAAWSSKRLGEAQAPLQEAVLHHRQRWEAQAAQKAVVAAMQRLVDAREAFGIILAVAAGECSAAARAAAVGSSSTTGVSESNPGGHAAADAGGSKGSAAEGSKPGGGAAASGSDDSKPAAGHAELCFAELATLRARALDSLHRRMDPFKDVMESGQFGTQPEALLGEVRQAELGLLQAADGALRIVQRFGGRTASGAGIPAAEGPSEGGSSGSGKAAAGSQGVPMTASHLAAVDRPEQRKQQLGEKLFPLVAALTSSKLAGKITGMLLEMDNAELLVVLAYPPRLEMYVKQAVKILGQHGMLDPA